MKATTRADSRVVGRLCVFLALLVAAGAAVASQARLDANLATPVLLEGGTQTAYLRVAVTGQPLPDTEKRTPVNVAIVVDRSGSMQGEKIRAAREAAKMAVDRLRPDDIVSIVAYESTVEVLLPATRASDTASIHEAIDRITANGSTSLFAGVSKGAGEVRKFLDRTRVNRIILLSDGLANVGPSSPGELADLGGSLGAEGIAVTTLGLGLDYNEDLMTRLAQKSDGNHMFVENTTDLAKAYSIEFGDVMSVVAQDVDIRITCADGVRPVRVLGRDASIDGAVVRTSLNQLVSEQTKYLILEVEAPARKAGDTAAIADVRVSYLDLGTSHRTDLGNNVIARYTSSAAEVEKLTDATIMASVIQQIGNERNALAMSLRDQGRIDEARDLFMSNGEFLYSNSLRYNSPALNEDAASNRSSVDNLDGERWIKERKIIQEKQFQTKQQSVGLKK